MPPEFSQFFLSMSFCTLRPISIAAPNPLKDAWSVEAIDEAFSDGIEIQLARSKSRP
jgi:hypothetical protein